MEENNIIAIIIAILGLVISTVGIWLTYSLYKRDKKNELGRKLTRILELGMEYPYLENKEFISGWIQYRTSQDEKYLRYDIYCNMIFNYLHDVYDFFGGNKNKIENYMDVKSWIRVHKDCWLNPVEDCENVDGYDEPFRKFINSYII